MSINLRVVGVYFQEEIQLKVSKKTKIIDVMNAAQKQFPTFSFSSVTGNSTLHKVTNKAKIDGLTKPAVLKDSDSDNPAAKVGDIVQTWQSYIFRNGHPVDIDGVFVPFAVRPVKDGDSVVWRLVSIVKRKKPLKS